MLVINSNIPALNSANRLKINTEKNAKSIEKLSSGYRINKSADDAAGLAISEKMRSMIRGLDRGTINVADGISWVQTGEGALNEAHDILHRMSEITVQSLNDTNTDYDRMALEMEFEALQSELDRIGYTTEFNEMPVFSDHEDPYYQCEGNIRWDPQQIHAVTAGFNDLTIYYRKDDASPQEAKTITVPPGEYTTQELVDEIESVLGKWNPDGESFIFEFTKDNTCNVNLEGGKYIDTVSGGLSYLLNQVYRGGAFGALIGTTSFPTEYSKLKIDQYNNHMSFSIEDFSGNSQTKVIDLPAGKSYTRKELIDILNDQLKDTTVTAIPFGTGIKLSSEDAIVTGFKGNMFRIDGKEHTSVFYDNVKYGTVQQSGAVFTGGYVLPTNSRDQEHRRYHIDASNCTLVLQPNGADKPVTITLNQPGDYTASELAGNLNDAFKLLDLKLDAKSISSNGFEGLQIESLVKGTESSVGIDPSCSAFQTLFVSREYNQYGTQAERWNETRTDKNSSFTASKDLSGVTGAAPLTITAGSNDSFQLTITEGGAATTVTVKLKADTYNSINDIQSEIDRQLNGSSAPIACKDKLKVSLSANGQNLVFEGAGGQKVDSIRISADGQNGGYNEIIQGFRNSSSSQDASGVGSVTLNTPFDGNIDSSNDKISITVGGIKYTVTLPHGNPVSNQDIIDAIESQIKSETVTTPITFPTVYNRGTTINKNFQRENQGSQSVRRWSGSNRGTSDAIEGQAGTTNNVPAKLLVNIPLKDNMTAESPNNKIELTLNDRTETITLTPGTTYTPASLKNFLQSEIDNRFGSDFGGATVELQNGKLFLQSRLPDGADGKETYISVSTDSSSFLKELNTTRNPAVITSSIPLASSIAIENGQTFEFQFRENGVSHTVSLPLTPKSSYTPAGIVDEINNQLQNQNIGVTASVSNTGNLVLTTTATGSSASISYNSAAGGNATEALFGPMTEKKPATVTVQRDIQPNISIKENDNDQFSITVNGENKTFQLTKGDYNRQDFVTMLNKRLEEENIDLEASLDGNKLAYTTKTAGNNTSISMNYNGGGTAMKPIYGETTTTTPGINASFDTTGKLVLVSTIPGSTIVVPSSGGGAFQKPTVTPTPISPSYSDGYHSTKYSYVDGVSLSNNISIDQWNNNLSFDFIDNGKRTTVEIEVPGEKSYTYDELQKTLQDLLDNSILGPDKITVTVNADGVYLQAKNSGNQYQFSNLTGDFYDKVMCQCTEKQLEQKTAHKDGSQYVDTAYTVGRKDVKNQGAEIRQGICDELTLDFTYGSQVHKIHISLDPGKYSGEALQQHLQQKLNQELKNMGLEENLILVGLGDINSGVYGSNDQNAINFKLSETANLPASGEFIIDGVSGNAAFEIFYQTDGKMIPAYVIGTKDISQGVTITPEDTNMTLEADGTTYTITLPEGELSSEKLIEEINQSLKNQGAPLVASMENNNLKISHTKMGEHTIDKVMGGARDDIFFSENWDEKEERGIYIQCSSQEDDKIKIKKNIFSTSYLGINSVCISKPKYAQKAMERLETALEMTSSIRSYFGSMQNRLEFTSNNNQNKSENTQRAESSIRDAKMAEEMVTYANTNILMQAGQAILAQAHQAPNRILQLLG